MFAVLRISFSHLDIWTVDIFTTTAAAILVWMQSKRFTELSTSYSLAAHEISLIRERSKNSFTENDFSIFVGDAENAFSREHTQWAARKDV